MKKQKVKVFGRLLEAEAPLRVKFEFPVEDASALVNPVCLTYKESTKELVKCQDVTQADIVDNNKVVCSCDDSATMYEDVDFLFRDKKEQEGNTLSTGVIVAIVIVSLIVVGLVIIIVLTNLKKQENKKNNMHMISEKE